jgi:hypothetical protein
LSLKCDFLFSTFAFKINLYRCNTAMGLAGLAILGLPGAAISQRHLLVYDAAKRPHLQFPIHASFKIHPQPGNYATFYAADGQGWSVLMRSREEWEALAREVVLARYAAGVLAAAGAAAVAPVGIVTMDVTPPPAGDEAAAPPLTIAEWDTVQVTYTVYGHAEGRWAAASTEPLHAVVGLALFTTLFCRTQNTFT